MIDFKKPNHHNKRWLHLFINKRCGFKKLKITNWKRIRLRIGGSCIPLRKS